VGNSLSISLCRISIKEFLGWILFYLEQVFSGGCQGAKFCKTLLLIFTPYLKDFRFVNRPCWWPPFSPGPNKNYHAPLFPTLDFVVSPSHDTLAFPLIFAFLRDPPGQQHLSTLPIRYEKDRSLSHGGQFKQSSRLFPRFKRSLFQEQKIHLTVRILIIFPSQTFF